MIADNIPLIVASCLGLLVLYVAACMFFGNDM
ncbi:hypothetical protein ABIE28_001676 [Devosia sp. 2618]